MVSCDFGEKRQRRRKKKEIAVDVYYMIYKQ
jgi:hypothetical protein